MLHKGIDEVLERCSERVEEDVLEEEFLKREEVAHGTKPRG